MIIAKIGIRLLVVFVSIFIILPDAYSQVKPMDLKSDTWVATDGLGRVLPDAESCGAPRHDKYVGIFYFQWLGQHGTSGPHDITKLLNENPSDPAWGDPGAFHHWGESELGYYLSDDDYVIRQHARMLVDAGVDTIILDNSNGYSYTENLKILCEAYRQIRAEGEQTPQFMLLAHNGLAPNVFRDFYCGGDELWSLANQIQNFKVDQGVMEFDVTGEDPFMLSPADLDLDASVYYTLRLRMKNTTQANQGQLYWISQDDGSYGENKSITFSISADDSDFHEYSIDLSGIQGWSGNIKQLRLDPVAHGDVGRVEIDWIKIQGAEASDEVAWDYEGSYPELWFCWDGKPMMLTVGDPDELGQSMHDIFTLRQSWAWSASSWFADGYDKWPWLDHYPQAYGWHTIGQPEEVAVCVAQHPTTNIGRSFHDGAEPVDPTTVDGKCFSEQWRRALEIDPEFIFITGWNEWVAQRFVNDGNQNNFIGQSLPVGGTFFVDCYNQEYSRDIEPMKGGHADNYYYQMIDGIRRFKGVRPLEVYGEQRNIEIDGAYDDWHEVQATFYDWKNDIAQRNHPGWGDAGQYVNTTGRNDFVTMKVAHDKDNINFFVETKEPITANTGDGWMWLLIDSDEDVSTGWQGYDYLLNAEPIDDSTTTIAECQDGQWAWQKVQNIPYRISGNKLEMKVPRAALGMDQESGEFGFDFHWVDNPQPGLEASETESDADLAQFWINGDSAPARRFNYRYLGVFDNSVSLRACNYQ